MRAAQQSYFNLTFMYFSNGQAVFQCSNEKKIGVSICCYEKVVRCRILFVVDINVGVDAFIRFNF